MNWIDFFQYALAQALIDACWSSAVLAISAYGLLTITQKQSAAFRHNLAMLILTTMLLLPVWRFVVVFKASLSHSGINATHTTALNVAAGFVPMPVAQLGLISEPLLYFSWFWLLGAMLMLLRLAGAFMLLERWVGPAETALLHDWQQGFEQLCQRMQIRRRVTLRILQHSLEPWSAYIFKPVVAIPAQLLQQLSRHQVVAILAHELAHIKRYDWLWNTWQCLIEALLFFHPGVWWLSRQIRVEREHACDDLALQQAAIAPLNLAEALAQFAQLRHAQGGFGSGNFLASYATGHPSRSSPLFNRIRRLVLPSPPTRLSGRASVLAGLLVLVLLASPILVQHSFTFNLRTESILSDSLSGSENEPPADGTPSPPQAPQPEAAPEIPPPPAPPAPPAPPPVPSLEKLAIFKDIQSKLAQDPRVLQMLGSPLKIAQHGHGRIYIKEWWFEPGQTEARLSLPIEGPLGKATLQVHALRPEQNWQFRLLNLQQSDSAQTIDLLGKTK